MGRRPLGIITIALDDDDFLTDGKKENLLDFIMSNGMMFGLPTPLTYFRPVDFRIWKERSIKPSKELDKRNYAYMENLIEQIRNSPVENPFLKKSKKKKKKTCVTQELPRKESRKCYERRFLLQCTGEYVEDDGQTEHNIYKVRTIMRFRSFFTY